VRIDALIMCPQYSV